MTALNEAKKEKIQAILNEVESTTDFDKLKSIKACLDKWFGADYNQIYKMTPEDVLNKINSYEIGTSNIINWVNRVSDADFQRHIIDRIIPNNHAAYQAIIHIPETEITNSENEKALLKDIFIRFWIKPKGTIVARLEGIRSTYTESEWESGYSHSHLPQQDPSTPITFQGFCLGSGEILQVLAQLTNEYKEVNMNLLCIHLKNFIKWESIEGNPYIRMKLINKERRSIRATHSLGSEESEYCTRIFLRMLKRDQNLRSEFEKVLDLSYYPIRIAIASASDGMARVIGQTLLPLLSQAQRSRLLVRRCTTTGANLNYISSPAQRPEISYEQRNQVIIPEFKGRQIRIQINPNEQQEEQTQEPNPECVRSHPGVTSAIASQLNRIFTSYALEAGRIA